MQLRSRVWCGTGSHSGGRDSHRRCTLVAGGEHRGVESSDANRGPSWRIAARASVRIDHAELQKTNPYEFFKTAKMAGVQL